MIKKFLCIIFYLLLQFFGLFNLSAITNNNSNLYSLIENLNSKYYDQRIKNIVIHYTALDFNNSIKILTEEEVSSHYLIPDKLIDYNQKIFSLVKENYRAWHAGNSYWHNRTNLNDTSIGIEIINIGYKYFLKKRYWFPFNYYQINMLTSLLKDIINKYKIQSINILGHNDISPGRKLDPGPLFPWKKLYEKGIGIWYDENIVNNLIKIIEKNPKISIRYIQKKLKKYGYKIEITGELDKETLNTIKSFQIHFRPNNFSGIPDSETIAILKNLIKKYYT